MQTDKARIRDRVLEDANLLQDVFATVTSHLALPHELGREVAVGLFVLAFSDDSESTPEKVE